MNGFHFYSDEETITISEIKKEYFPFLGLPKLGDILQYYNHPRVSVASTKVNGGAKRSYRIDGLDELQDLFVMDTALEKDGERIAIYAHDKIGRFQVRKSGPGYKLFKKIERRVKLATARTSTKT